MTCKLLEDSPSRMSALSAVSASPATVSAAQPDQ
jgi:hypothetical protein